MAIISDSSPLIALVQIGQLALLESLYTTVLIPSAVRQEIARSVPPHPWLQERPLMDHCSAVRAVGAMLRDSIYFRQVRDTIGLQHVRSRLPANVIRAPYVCRCQRPVISPVSSPSAIPATLAKQ